MPGSLLASPCLGELGLRVFASGFTVWVLALAVTD